MFVSVGFEYVNVLQINEECYQEPERQYPIRHKFSKRELDQIVSRK